MNKTKNTILVTLALAAFGLTTSCSFSVGTNQPAANQPAANKATNAAPAANKPAEPAKTDAPKPVAGPYATPTDAYKAAYAARQAKDIEALKQVLSKDALGFFKEMAEMDGKTVDAALKELTDEPQAPRAETKNEKIDGNKATLDYLDERGGWSPMEFVKEDGGWKLTIPKPDENPAPSGK